MSIDTYLTRFKAAMNDPHTFPFFVSRDFCDDPQEIAIEIVDYRPPDKRHYSGCEYDPGYIMLEAHTLDGKSFDLTPTESEQAESEALKLLKP